MTTCGIIHPADFANVRDPNGCTLPLGHHGPHRFVSSGGATYLWEESPCADCNCDLEAGECCTEYWRVPPSPAHMLTPATQTPGGEAMSTADDFTDAFDALIEEMGPADALAVITGTFVYLTLAVVKNAGHSVDGDLKIDGGKNRDITIHAAKQPTAQQAQVSTK